MKTGRWLGLLCAVGVGFVVVSCDEEVPTAPEEVTTPTTTGAASNPADNAPPTTPLSEATPMFATSPPANSGSPLSCMGDHAVGFVNGAGNPTALNCTSDDVKIAIVQTGSGTPPTCVEGSPVTVNLQAVLLIGSNESRSDNGIWIATDGGEPEGSGPSGDPSGAETGVCDYWAIDRAQTYSNPFVADGDGDDCGGMPSNSQGQTNTINLGDVTIVCKDSDNNGSLDAGGCLGWKVPGQNTECPDDAAGDGGSPTLLDYVKGTLPGTRAKCRCELLDIPVQVVREAEVKVVKALSPSNDAGTFDLEIKNYDGTATLASATAVGDGGAAPASGFVTVQWLQTEEGTQNKASVAEPGANLGSLDESSTPASAFDFYTTTYSCVEANNGNGPVSGSGTGPVNLTLENGDEWTCTFTNTRIAPPAVTVTKTANESFDRAWSWQLAKTVYKNGAVSPAEVCSTLDVNIEDATLPLQLGQLYTACYVVTATPGGPTDSNHLVTGTISVSVAASTAPYTGNFTITDQLDPGDVDAVVDCDGTAGSPFDNTKSSVPQGGSFSCTYSASLTAAQAAALTTDTATASVSWNTGDSGTHKGNAASSFSGVTPTNESDETADVTDTWYNQPNFNLQLAVPASGGVATWTFARNLQCPDYGDTLIPNDAYLDSNDGGYDLEDDADVTVSCPPPPSGCTLTQGYWRTHSQFGPAPYSDNWEVITPAGAATEFSEGFDGVIDSEMTYYEVLWDPGKGGNAWFKLGHQYIAAQLNILNGADPSLVSTWMADAQSILNYYDQDAPGKKNSIPKQGDAWCQSYGGACTGYNSDRQYAMYLNNKLTQYNEGTLPGGPMHCDDDAQSFYGSNVE